MKIFSYVVNSLRVDPSVIKSLAQRPLLVLPAGDESSDESEDDFDDSMMHDV